MSDPKLFSDFRSKFMVDTLLISQTNAWSWSVRPSQPTLGAGILSLNRHALHFSDVTAQEMAELAELIKLLENAVKSAFNHNIMNYLMLMMVDHHVHFHVIPRYDGVRQFSGLEWIDNGWPALPVMGDSQHKNQEGVLLQIQDTLMSTAGI
ncbi:MAG: HIT family protein [Desulfobulbaceae bacterium]|nr:HIT family protein [Desulfobulbaceae bacterium]